MSRDSIIEAARHCFFHYGYSRTRMGDIADRAGISRAHLYNHFDSKKAAFCALSKVIIDESFVEIDAALAADGPVWKRVAAAIDAWTDQYFKLMETPHGVEVMEEAHRLEGVLDDAHRRLDEKLAATLRAAHDDGEISFGGGGLTAAGCADMLIAAADGFKAMGADRATFNKRLGVAIASLRIATSVSASG